MDRGRLSARPRTFVSRLVDFLCNTAMDVRFSLGHQDRMRSAFLFLFVLLGSAPACVSSAAEAKAGPVVHLAGDSTMSHKPLDLPERGWGMALNGFFKDPAMVHNHAVNGRSTKSFINEGRWTRLTTSLQPGDFVIIQFGHNDEKIDKPGVGTDPKTEYRDNLRRFIREVKARQGQPILATSIARRKFDPAGNLQSTHGTYPEAMREVAKEEDVPLLDLEDLTEKWLREEGVEASKRFFMWIPVGAHPKIPDGREDDTHLVEAGAVKIAGLAAAEIRVKCPELAQWLR